MAEYTNTIDLLGDDVLTDALLTREFPENFSGDMVDGNVIKLGAYALYGCNAFASVYFPNVTDIHSSGVAYCMNLVSIDFPELINVGQSAFQHCEKLVEMNLPRLKSITSNAFQHCKALKEIHLPEATSIPSYTFGNCTGLEVIDLPKVKNAQGSSFLTCTSLKEVILPAATYIVAPFMECSNLEKVYLPAIEQLGTNCFSRDSKLQEVNLGPNITKIDANAFSNTPNGLVINIPVEEGVIEGAPWAATGATINYARPYVGPNGESA